MHFYLAKNLQFGETEFDEDEDIETLRVSLPKLKDLIASGEIRDGKTIVALHLAQDSL